MFHRNNGWWQIAVVLSLVAWPASAAGDGRAELQALLAEKPREAGRLTAWRQSVDALANQKDAWASGLYWHTDLAAAKAVARAEKKPILSLRLLGRLDEAHSCANSRLFRSVLYPNARVSALLKERFVLHWRSVRPVPRVTVDFGDGRKLETTLTGNSIHYVLDAEGRPVDALPGLYGPGTFERELRRAEGLVQDLALLPAAARPARLAEALAERTTARPARPDSIRPSALEASRLTASKAFMELPLLEAVLPGEASPVGAAPAVTPQRLASARLDARSQALIREHVGGKDVAGVVARLERAIAADEAINETRLRPRVLGLLAAGVGDLEALNDRVYAEVFLTPKDDPYLGLAAGEIYNGLAGLGVKR